MLANLCGHGQDGFGHSRNLSLTDFVEGMRLDLGKFVLHVVRIHGANLFPSWSPEYFDDFDELVNARLAREQRLSQHEFGKDAASGPNVWKEE